MNKELAYFTLIEECDKIISLKKDLLGIWKINYRYRIIILFGAMDMAKALDLIPSHIYVSIAEIIKTAHEKPSKEAIENIKSLLEKVR